MLIPFGASAHHWLTNSVNAIPDFDDKDILSFAGLFCFIRFHSIAHDSIRFGLEKFSFAGNHKPLTLFHNSQLILQ